MGLFFFYWRNIRLFILYNPTRGGSIKMGKKRRYIQRVKKFGTKMFNFLDKVDGTADSILSASEIDNIVESLTLLKDRGNQTIALNSRLLGANFQANRVLYIVKDSEGNSHNVDVLVDHAGTGKDKFTAPASASGAAAQDENGVLILPAGTQTVTAQVFEADGAAADLTKPVTPKTSPKKLNVIRSAITATLAAGFVADGTSAGQIKVDLTKATFSGKQPGVETEYKPINDGDPATSDDRRGYKIVVQITAKPDADAVTVLNTPVGLGAGGGLSFTASNGNGNSEQDDILNTALTTAGDYSFKVTFTPLDGSDQPLTADAFDATHTITVAE